MCPTGRALNHPAADTLREWARFGCPTRTGRNWTREEMWEAVERGPHRSATTPEAIIHFAEEIREKISTHQARLVPWEDIKDNPPAQLKISPIAAIPHKSKAFRSILDLSFRLRLKNGGVLAAVNNTTVKSAPKGQLIRSENVSHGLSMRLQRRARTQKYLWQSGILKMGSGEWIAKRARNGPSRMCYHNLRRTR